jgi:O-antigen ligase
VLPFSNRLIPPSLLPRILGCLALAMILATALAYPLRLSDPRISKLYGWAKQWGVEDHFVEQLMPWLAFNHSPLVVKESLLLALGALLIAGSVLYLALNSYRELRTSDVPLLNWSNPALWMGAFFLLGFLRLALVPTPYMGLRTLLLMTICTIGPAAIVAVGQSRMVWKRIPALTLAIGIILALIALLQHLGRVRGWLPDQSGEPRNRMGSLIGHNTGLSGYLLFSCCVAVWGVLTRRGSFRFWSIAYLPLGLFVVLSAQSRSAWLAFAVAALVGAFLLGPSLGKMMVRRAMIYGGSALAIGLILATAFPSVNPLARQVTPLMERLRNDVFNLDQLRRETRYRVFFAGAPLVAQAPVFGHGPGQFQWVYPPAQGRYFNTHLNQTRAYTVKRTDIAHNDWLQFAIEFGIVGILLAGTAAYLVLRRIRENWLALPQGPERALLSLWLSAIAGLLVQAAVDFPFHLAAHGWLAALVLILAASRRTFGLQGAVPLPAKKRLPASAPPAQLRPRSVALLTGIGGGLVLLPIVFRVVSMDWVSDALYMHGNQLLSLAQVYHPSDLQGRRKVLEDARIQFRRANRVNQFLGVSYEAHGITAINLASIYAVQGRNSEQRGDGKSATAAYESSRNQAEVALAQMGLATTLGELRWHHSYLTIARAYSLLWYLRPDNMDQRQLNYARSAATAFEAAHQLNPVDAEMLLERAQFIEQPVIGQSTLAAQLRQRIWLVDPGAAEIQFLDPVRRPAWERNYAAAHQQLQRVKTQFPSEWRVSLMGAELHWLQAVVTGDLSTTRPVDLAERERHLALASAEVDQAEKDGGKSQPEVAYWRMLIAANRFQWKEAIAQASVAMTGRTVQREAETLLGMIREFQRGGRDELIKYQFRIGPIGGSVGFYCKHLMFTFGEGEYGAALLAQLSPGTLALDPPEALRGIEIMRLADNEPLAGMIARGLLRNRRISPEMRAAHEALAQRGELTPRNARPVPQEIVGPVPPWPVP